MVLAKIERLLDRSIGVQSAEIDATAALQERKKLLESARESIKIVSADIPNLDDLKVPLDRGVEVEVIVGRANSVMDFIPPIRKGVKVYELSEKPSKQYDIVDSNHLRFEELRGGQKKQYIVYDVGELLVSRYSRKFRKLKEETVAK